MNNTVQASDTDGRRGLSGTAVKYIAAALMVFDHLHQFFQAQGAPVWFNMLGRPVLPVFLYMAAEGFRYTRNRKRYILRLLGGFWFMNVMNYVLSVYLPLSNLPEATAPALMNNVFSTMLMTVFYLFAVTVLTDGVREKRSGRIFLGVMLLLLPVAVTAAVLFATVNASNPLVFQIASFIPDLLTVEGGFTAVLLGLLFGLLHRRRRAQMAALAALSALTFAAGSDSGYNIQWMMVFAVIPLMLYNGKRGRGGNFDKYFFYIFYPAHIYLLYIAAWALQR